MFVQSLKLIVCAVLVLEFLKCSTPKNYSLAKFLWTWKPQHHISFKTRFLIKLPSVKFLLKSLTSRKSVLEEKVNIWTPSGCFRFFISFFCWNEINKKSSVKEDAWRWKIVNCKANHILDRSSHRGPATLLKRDSGTGVFPWILRNFQYHLFYRTPPGDCFCLE